MYIIIIYILIIWMKSYLYTKSSIDQEHKNYFYLAKSEGLQVTSKEIKEFLSGRTEEQQLKESRNTKQSQGHIVSYNPFNRLQLDIFVLKKYESSNNGYGYILCIMDIFRLIR